MLSSILGLLSTLGSGFGYGLGFWMIEVSRDLLGCEGGKVAGWVGFIGCVGGGVGFTVV